MNAPRESSAFAVSPGGILVPHGVGEMLYPPKGKQARGTMQDIEPGFSDSDALLELLIRTVHAMGATIIKDSEYRYSSPDGSYLVGKVGLEESHAVIHLYSKIRKALVDIFTCGDAVDPRTGIEILHRELRSALTRVTYFGRGVSDIQPESYMLRQ